MADVMFIVGVILVAVGLGAIHWFLAPIFVGSLLILLAYYAASSKKVETPKVKHIPFHPDITAN